jgi:hypothetical protein
VIECFVQESENIFSVITSDELASLHAVEGSGACSTVTPLKHRGAHEAIQVSTELKVDESNEILVCNLRESLYALSKKRNTLELLILGCRRLLDPEQGFQLKENQHREVRLLVERSLQARSDFKRLVRAALIMGIEISKPEPARKHDRAGEAGESDEEWGDVVFEAV